MVWKKVVNSDAGDADHFGGDDLDKVSDLFGGTAVADGVDMNSSFTFRNQKLKMRNSGNTASIIYDNPPITGDCVGDFTRPFNHCIYKQGSNYKIMNGATNAVTTAADPDTIVQTALTAAGLIYWVGDTSGAMTSWTLSGAFAGWTLKPQTTMIIGNGVQVLIPNSYAGYVFYGDDQDNGLGAGFGGLSNVTFQGGNFREVAGGGGALANWDLFKLEAKGVDTSTGKGIERCIFKDIFAKNCNKMFHLLSSGDHGFINGNHFIDCKATNPRMGVHFDLTTTFSSGSSMHRNTFTNLIFSADTTDTIPMTNGFKDIQGKSNLFLNCKAWDTTTGNSDCNTTVNATDTVIILGMMTREPTDWATTQDLGTNTRVIDQYNENILPLIRTNALEPRTGSNTITVQNQTSGQNTNFNIMPRLDSNSSAISIKNNVTTNTERIYLQKQATTQYNLVVEKSNSSGALRPLICRMVDLVGTTDVEAFRVNTDASMQYGVHQDHKVISAPASPASGYVRIYAKQVDSNNDGLFCKVKINGAVQEVQIA